jgi:hypothetical protein
MNAKTSVNNELKQLCLTYVAYPLQIKRRLDYMWVCLYSFNLTSCLLPSEHAHVLGYRLLSLKFLPRSIFLVDDKIAMADGNAVLLLTF